MDNTIPPPVRTDLIAVPTAPRPTAPPPRVPFAQVLGGSARALVSGAQAAMNLLPGSPVIAAALRGATGTGSTMTALDLPMNQLGTGAPTAFASPEGPGGAVSGAGMLGAGGTSGSGGEGSGLEGTLAQEQQLNMYYLQIQEQVNEQNRTFTALSNVLEVEHNTAKAAIGNIH
jgi:hypothetical protein